MMQKLNIWRTFTARYGRDFDGVCGYEWLSEKEKKKKKCSELVISHKVSFYGIHKCKYGIQPQLNGILGFNLRFNS